MKKDDPKNLQRKKKRNRRRLFSLLVFILLLVYLPALWNWLFSSNVEIGVIKSATLELKVPVKGVIVRKEQLLTSPGNGIVIPTIPYGDKVAAHHEVASFISSDMRDMVKHYREMKLEILKRAVTKFDSAAGSEREQWEKAIEKQIEKLTDASNSGDLTSLTGIRGSIDDILEARAMYMLENTDGDDALKIEKNELGQLETSIDKSVTEIGSPASGVVSYYMDGHEASFLPDRRGEITLESIDAAIASESASERWITPAEIEVKKDQVFAKLVTNDEAWVVFYVSRDQGKKISHSYEKRKMEETDFKLDMEMEGLQDRIPLVIESVREIPNDKYMIIGRMNQLIELTMDKRGFAGNLVLSSVTGMKVPMKSLTGLNNVDNTADIVLVEMNKAVYKRVQIAATQDAYAIIENLDTMNQEKTVNLYDVYVVNPRNIEEGQVIEK